jgi:hypothetical protein
MFSRVLTAFSRWGLDDDVPTPPVTDSEVDAFVAWMWARPQDRPSMIAALAELRNDDRTG